MSPRIAAQSLLPHVIAIAAAALEIALTWATMGVLGETTIYLTLCPLVMLVSLVLGLWPGITASIVACIGMEYLLIAEPVHLADAVRILVVVFAGAVTGLVGRTLRIARARAEREACAARQVEQNYRHLVEGSGSVMLRADREMRITFMNQYGLEFFGYTAEELIGQRALGTIIPWADAEGHDIAAMAEDLMQHPEWYATNVHQNRRKDGRLVWMSWANKPIYDAEGNLTEVLAIGNDLSKLKMTEEALKISEEKYRQLFESMSEGFLLVEPVLDRAGKPVSYRYLDANPALERLTHLKRQDIIGKDARDVLPNIEPHWIEIFGRVALTGEPAHIEQFCSDVNGWYRVYAYCPAPGKAAAIYADISERKRAEEALRDSEQRLALALESGEMGMWEWNVQTDYSVWNAKEYEVFGLPPGSGREPTRTFWDLIHPDDLPQFQRIIAEVIDHGSDLNSETRIIRPDGNIRWLAAIGRVQRDGEGRAVRMIGVNFDITDRKRAEESRQQLLEAERAARGEFERVVRMKDDFVAVVSHELRSPLSAIVGWTQLLARGKAETAKAVDIISRSAATLNDLVDDLLDMSGILSGKIRLKRECANLIALVADAAETVHFAAEAKAICIDLSFSPDLQPLECDAGRMRQVITNLLSNAVKFTPHGGQVWVAVNQSPTEVRIEVRDTGKGIAPDFLPHVFEQFRQEDGSIARKHGGLGLGLSITRHLVELHGGKIEVESEGEGQGSTFTVVVPRTSIDEARDSTPRVPVQRSTEVSFGLDERTLAGIKVLGVDDDPSARDLIDRVLSDAGASVRTAGSPGEAVRIIKEYRPDVLVCDIGMPDEDGQSFVRKLRASAEFKSLPCIAVTALTRPEDREQTLKAGFNAHVGKPFDPGRLAMLILELSGRACEIHPRPQRDWPRQPGEPEALQLKRAHLLLAEDNPAICEILKSALDEAGYQVSTASTVADAVRLSEKQPVDLLLSDLRLKDGTGWELMARLREKRAVPGIMMSGYADAFYRARSKKAGFQEYLAKPVDTDVLCCHVARLLKELA